MIKLFLDQALPLRAESTLRDRGWDVVHAASAGLATAPDSEILKWCHEHRYTIITHDHGFHQMIALGGAVGPSVVRVRLQGLNHEAVANLIDRVVRSNVDAIEAGCLLSVTKHRVKVRSLPMR